MMNFGDDFSEKVLRGLSVVCTAAIVLYSPVFSMAANKTVHIAKLGDTDDYTTIRATRSGNNDYVRFHFAKKDGTYLPVLDHGRIVENRYYGNVFYVLIMDCALIESYYDNKTGLKTVQE